MTIITNLIQRQFKKRKIKIPLLKQPRKKGKEREKT